MKKDSKIKEYLLGNIISEEEKTAMEEELMTSDHFFQELLAEEDNLIEDYVDEKLTANERENFEKRFLISVERREKVNFSVLLKNYISARSEPESVWIKKERPERTIPIWRKLFLSPLPVAAVILIALGIIGFIVFYPPEDGKITTSLNKAYSRERPLESRITAFDYAPADNLRGNGKEKVDTISRDLAKNLSLEAAQNRQTAENLHNLGRVYLAEKEFDKAIAELTRAKAGAPQNAQITSDLGTTFFEKSKNLSQSADGAGTEFTAKALEQFEKAIEINPDLPEPRFNKAVLLQYQQNTPEARKAWQEYLKLDSDSRWADEARRNLKLSDSQN